MIIQTFCLLSWLIRTEGLEKDSIPVDTKHDALWSDCSAEVGVDHPKLLFSDVRSEPRVVTVGSGQTVYKTITYSPASPEAPPVDAIRATLTQRYHAFDRTWVTFIKVPGVDECSEHDGTATDAHGHVDGPLCPLAGGDSAELLSVHAPLNRWTPFGLYRSRQVYREGLHGEIIGCVDMQFLYCNTDQPVGSTTCQKKTNDPSSPLSSRTLH